LARPDGDHLDMNGAEGDGLPTPPTTAERRAVKLLPLVWIGVLVLGAVILYLVLR
jgi:hypothetical protein